MHPGRNQGRSESTDPVEREILVVESDPAFGAALAALLEASGKRVRRATACPSSGPYAAILVDIGDREPHATVREVALRAPGSPILAISCRGDADLVLAAIRAGAQGLLLRADVARWLGAALEELRHGRAPLSPEAGRALFSSLRSEDAPPESGVHDALGRTGALALTPRERDVLGELARGLTYEQVALALGVSVNTVRTRVKAIYEKLGAATRTEAVLAAMQRGLISASAG